MKILMVCLGNICRSPVAEGILRQKLIQNGLDDIVVDSCGTSGHHNGESPDQRSQQNALENNTDISDLISRQFAISDFDQFDRIYCMDQSNYNDVKRLSRNNADRLKLDLLLNISFPGENRRVPDPYFGGSDGFQKVYDLIENACDKLVTELIENR